MKRPGKIALRNAVDTVLGWLHCALLFAPYYAMVMQFVAQDSTREFAIQNHLRGLLFFLPVMLSWFAARYLKSILLYLPASILIGALTALVFGHIALAVPAVFICFLRFYSRVNRENRSALDHGGYPAIGLLLAPAIFSVFETHLDAAFQLMGLLFAALYFLLCFVQNGIARIQHYVDVNRDMYNFPARRIVRLLGVLLTLATVVGAMILLPPLMMNNSELRFIPKEAGTGTSAPVTPSEPVGGGGPTPDLSMLGGEANPFFAAFFEVLQYLLIAAVGIGAIVGIVAAAIHISRAFRSSYRDRGDLVENLLENIPDEITNLKRQHRDRPGLLDRSPNAVIRRRWRKAILRGAKEPPARSASPAEAEAHAGLTGEANDRLHAVYEKARYSERGADRADVKA